MSDLVQPFRLAIEESQLDDLRRRLRASRLPDAETTPGWAQGVPRDQMERLRDHWLHHYDWRRIEAELNALGQYRTVIDGVGIHFLHIRSPEPDALPLLLTHGWPGSILEFLKVIGPLTDPAAHGGDRRDAFHLVIPSIPGYGFSDRPREPGWTIERVAAAWVELMARLGYDRFLAQGGDWGAMITHLLGANHPGQVQAIHLNMALAHPTEEERAVLTPKERESLVAFDYHRQFGRGYSEVHRTRPQTIGYALADSPLGQAAWIYEKFREWSDCDGDPLNSFTMDELLDSSMIYWLPNSGASSARLYWNSVARPPSGAVAVPIGASVFPREIFRSSERWMRRMYPTLNYWNEPERGGHFAAFEVPDLFVEEVRACFRLQRRSDF